MTDASSADDGFLSRLRVIEGQPLTARADAYSQLLEELSRRLEAGVPRSVADQTR